MRPKPKRGITTTAAKCGACGLVYADPRPVPADLQDHSGVPPESYWKAGCSTVSSGYFAEAIARFEQLVAFTPGMKALDMGPVRARP